MLNAQGCFQLECVSGVQPQNLMESNTLNPRLNHKPTTHPALHCNLEIVRGSLLRVFFSLIIFPFVRIHSFDPLLMITNKGIGLRVAQGSEPARVRREDPSMLLTL